MAFALGVDLGTTYTAAAVRRTDRWGRASSEAIGLGGRAAVAASVVFIGPDGRWLVGDAAERRAHERPDLVVREFKRRIGDPVPMVVGDARPLAESLAAGMVRWVVDRVTEQEGEAPSAVTLTHPASWGTYKLTAMVGALEAVGLGHVSLVSEPVAAAAHYAAQSRISVGAAIAVYDLGGGTFDAAVVRKVGEESFELLGEPGGQPDVGGSDFDEAVLRQVQRTAQLPSIDVHDEEASASMLRLRRECIEAKEALSDDTDATIPVLLPGLSTRVRLVRSEFEELVHDRLVGTIDTLAATIASSGLAPDELDAVLLVGGSSRIPLVCQLVSERIGRPIVVDADPKLAVALGAASIAATRTNVEAGAPRQVTARSAGPVIAVASSGSDLSTTSGERTTAPVVRQRPAATVAAADGGRRLHRRGAVTIAGVAAGVAIAAGASVALIRPFDSPAAPALAQAQGSTDAAAPAPRDGAQRSRSLSTATPTTTAAVPGSPGIDPIGRSDTVATVAAMVPVAGSTIEGALRVTSEASAI
ncbi:MAG: Hsp70 family protein, partial [Ilumatobacteraceae bacterium]